MSPLISAFIILVGGFVAGYMVRYIQGVKK